ncbi:hypothetical protein GUJ93_ZPchr0013g34968 [Zizania palustris]|uniref:VOC domain-containing protein n=1 Tax=Zizania palustris TaxID=103762 RepID=A0A8J5X604_ZIZPA|nr:hypothetical protein GUJ93_ZPchr0013g34968 [Zizania palustris]
MEYQLFSVDCGVTATTILNGSANLLMPDYGVVSIHHVGILCENLERSMAFYKDLLGLKVNPARPTDKLPYRGAWLWVGSEMIHLMELPNPDPLTGRPEHGGRDRHTCIAIKDVLKLKEIFDKAGIKYTLSKSGRPAIFARDPDENALEFTQVASAILGIAAPFLATALCTALPPLPLVAMSSDMDTDDLRPRLEALIKEVDAAKEKAIAARLLVQVAR